MLYWNKWSDDDGRGPCTGQRLSVDPDIMRAIAKRPAHAADRPAFQNLPAQPTEGPEFGRRIDGPQPIAVLSPPPVATAPLPECLAGPQHAEGSPTPGPLPHPVRAYLRQIDDPSIEDPWAAHRAAQDEQRQESPRPARASDQQPLPLWSSQLPSSV